MGSDSDKLACLIMVAWIERDSTFNFKVCHALLFCCMSVTINIVWYIFQVGKVDQKSPSYIIHKGFGVMSLEVGILFFSI